MYNLINRLRSFNSRPETEVFWVQTDDTTAGETYGRYVPGAPYSAKLRRLVYRCLSRQPDLRPKPRALVAEIQADLNGAAPAAAASTAEAANIGLAIPVVVPPALIIRPEPDSSVSSRVTKFSV